MVETLGIKPDEQTLIHSFAPHPVSVTNEEDGVHGDLRQDTSNSQQASLDNPQQVPDKLDTQSGPMHPERLGS